MKKDGIRLFVRFDRKDKQIQLSSLRAGFVPRGELMPAPVRLRERYVYPVVSEPASLKGAQRHPKIQKLDMTS